MFFNCYLSNGKRAFVDNLRVKATMIFIESGRMLDWSSLEAL